MSSPSPSPPLSSHSSAGTRRQFWSLTVSVWVRWRHLAMVTGRCWLHCCLQSPPLSSSGRADTAASDGDCDNIVSENQFDISSFTARSCQQSHLPPHLHYQPLITIQFIYSDLFKPSSDQHQKSELWTLWGWAECFNDQPRVKNYVSLQCKHGILNTIHPKLCSQTWL